MKRINCLCFISSLALSLVAGTTLQAYVRVPCLFSQNMVLQRDMRVPVWGWAEPGEKVTVTFAEQEQSTVANNDGKWMVKLDSMTASKSPRNMTIVGEKNKIVIPDVLVGEVWLCSGQSNMAWPYRMCANAEEEIANSDYPLIRNLYIVLTESITPQERVNGGPWTVSNPQRKGGGTAVGYQFAKALFQELDVPIGIISSSRGGTCIEAWTPLESFAVDPKLSKIYDQYKHFDSTTKKGAQTYKSYIEKMKKWIPAAENAIAANKPVPPLPQSLNAGTSRHTPTKIFNAMINPLAPYGIRGVIWYQGENNGNESVSYYHKMKALITGWRNVWKQGEFPFYYVQLANFKYPNTQNPEGGDGWANLREAQFKSLSIPNTGMAVAIDIGERTNIHPKNKQDVGKRLARWALANDYGKKIVPSGPLYKDYQVEGNKIRITFDYVGSGLMIGEKNGLAPTEEVKNGKLKWFAIKAKDGKWYWADAEIDGETVVVSSDEVKEPVAVRYAFTMNPEGANLYNKEGLPASPFKTDGQARVQH